MLSAFNQIYYIHDSLNQNVSNKMDSTAIGACPIVLNSPDMSSHSWTKHGLNSNKASFLAHTISQCPKSLRLLQRVRAVGNYSISADQQIDLLVHVVSQTSQNKQVLNSVNEFGHKTTGLTA